MIQMEYLGNLEGRFSELIKDVEIAFIEDLSNNTILFQEIICDISSDGSPCALN